MSPAEFLEEVSKIYEQREKEVARCFKAGNLAEADYHYGKADNAFEALSNQISPERFQAMLRFATLRVESANMPEGIVAPLESIKNLAENLTDKASLTWEMIINEVKDRIDQVSVEEERNREEKQRFVLPMSPQKAAWKEKERQLFRENWIRSGGDPAIFETGTIFMGLPVPKALQHSQTSQKLETADTQSTQQANSEPDDVLALEVSKPILKPGRPPDPNCDEAIIERLLVKCGFTVVPIASVALKAFKENKVLDQLPEGWEAEKVFKRMYAKFKNRRSKKTVIQQ